MAHLTVEGHLSIKAQRIEKGWAVNRMIVDFLLILQSGLGANFVYVRNLP